MNLRTNTRTSGLFWLTANPAAIRAESPDAPLRWLPLHEAKELTSEANLRELLARVDHLLPR